MAERSLSSFAGAWSESTARRAFALIRRGRASAEGKIAEVYEE